MKGSKAKASTSSNMTEEEVAAKLHIEEIRTQKFSTGKKDSNPLTLDLHHAVTSLSAELYQKDIHFLMELIQNAEDNEYQEGVEPTLEFVLTKEDITGSGASATLLVFNNEVGFTTKNMDSICSIGRSTKKGKRQQGFIGEKGIGFKSVFLVSSQPHIISNGYHVRFDEEPDQDCGIGYVVPQWISGKPYLSSICDVYGSEKILPTTTFVLPLKPDKVEAVRAQLSELHPEILLFLSKVKRLFVSGCDREDANDVSTISIFSETEHMKLSDKTAKSRFVQLSVKEKICDAEQLCKYFLWREEFPVQPRNKVRVRMDVEKWVITLAFPFGERLRRGTSSVGIFAFLPTAMVTNFPFIIQADFILASSRESILLDNVWNLGILKCVPLAFVNAFLSCAKDSSFPSISQPFEFLPAQDSPIPEFSNIRESIRTTLQDKEIVPCEVISGKFHFLWPKYALRIMPKFRDLLVRIRSEEGVTSAPISFRVLHPCLDVEKYSVVLEFLGVTSASVAWYTDCIKSHNLVLKSDEVYIRILDFLADNKEKFSKHINHLPLIKYINREANPKLSTVTKTTTAGMLKVRYSVEVELHSWLFKCNMEFGCPSSMYFLSISTLKALLNYPRSDNDGKTTPFKTSSLYNWLSYQAGVTVLTTYDYAAHLWHHVSTKEPSLAVRLANFLYHAHKKGFLSDSQIQYLCERIPVIDGAGNIRMQRTVTLVYAGGSKWVKLFGPQNPFVQQNYVDIGGVYSESHMCLEESTPKKELLNFLAKYSKAADLPELCPPDMKLQIASHELSSEQAFLLLDWIRLLRTRGSCLPTKFIESIRDGEWMKTYTGYISPRRAFLPNESGKIIFDMMKHVMGDFSILDLDFYENKITLYQDELKFLGVGLGSKTVRKLVSNHFESLTSDGMSKECTFALLDFISFSKQGSMVDKDWLAVMKEKKCLKTHNGYNAPEGSILLAFDMEVEACLNITNLPIVDEAFYGNRLRSFLSELRLLGVEYNEAEVQKLIAENVSLTPNLSSMTGDCGLLLLKCVRCLGGGATGLINMIKCQPWMKTTFGFKCPSETVLVDPCWGSLLSVLQVPAIDELYYGNQMRYFIGELKAMGVVVGNVGVTNMIAAQFSSLLSSSGLAPSNVMSLLGSIREISQTLPLQSPELNWLLSEKWLKTRHGFKTPKESIIFSAKWGSISLFVDLPLVDDIYYGLGIYKFKDELQMLGAITDFEGGAPFVATGLCSPIDPELLSADGFISLLECIKSLKSMSLDDPLLGDFVKNIAKSRCLKTRNGYKTPEECILFDPAWEGILKLSDAPTIDESFTGIDISLYNNQLRDIGVKVDPLDVCSLLSGLLLSLTDTAYITRIYSFLTKFIRSPQVLDKCNSKVWIPDPKGTGEWVDSLDCILHDKKNLFGSRMFCLENFYMKELLPMFSLAFGVAEHPSINDYLQLWNSWAMRDNFQVTVEECNSFWGCILDNWNQHVEDALNQKLTKLPATMSSMVGEIYMMSREEVFIADDFQLKTIFSSCDKVPLFVWFPRSNSSSFIPATRLHKIYECLGVKKISQSVEYIVCGKGSLDQCEKVESNELIRRGLIKLILGFLAGLLVDMSLKERHKAAQSVTLLSVYTSEKPIKVCYRLMPSASTTVEVEKIKLVLWEKNLQRLLIDRMAYEDGKADLEFVTSFADELAQGLLAHARPTAAAALSKIIQMGVMFDFSENEVNFLLMKENLELYMEDEQFLDSSFVSSGKTHLVYRKRSYEQSQHLDPSTAMVPCKKQREVPPPSGTEKLARGYRKKGLDDRKYLGGNEPEENMENQVQPQAENAVEPRIAEESIHVQETPQQKFSESVTVKVEEFIPMQSQTSTTRATDLQASVLGEEVEVTSKKKKHVQGSTSGTSSGAKNPPGSTD